MVYQEKFELNNISASYFADEIDILITGIREDGNIRNNYVLNTLKGFKGLVFCLQTDDSAQKFTY